MNFSHLEYALRIMLVKTASVDTQTLKTMR
jgi:hypothetical protein